jgi:tetratricopeptide (TPR) repeat protein
MKLQARNDDEHPQGSESPSTGECPTAAGDLTVATEVTSHPDQTAIDTTSGLRTVEAASDSQLRKDAPNSPQGGGHGEAAGPHPAHAPSITRALLYTGLVTVLGAGALGYSYFIGSSRPNSQKTSGKNLVSASGKEVGPGDDSGASGGGSDQRELAHAHDAWLAAVKELRDSREAEKAAKRSEEETKAVLDFIQGALLAGGRMGEKALTESFWSDGQAKDVTLRKALDATDGQVADVFDDRPVAEASVREMLGVGYLNVGEPSAAVKEFERALALREAVFGSTSAETAACRNQLAVAYRLTGRTAEAARLFERKVNSPSEAAKRKNELAAPDSRPKERPKARGRRQD